MHVARLCHIPTHQRRRSDVNFVKLTFLIIGETVTENGFQFFRRVLMDIFQRVGHCVYLGVDLPQIFVSFG